jgi:2-hydroxychromene-2-carboxylate isomerase
MNNINIDFYFDFLSPYSYLAWVNTRDRDLNFNYYPVSVPNIVASFETKGPGQIKPKRDYLMKDLFRYTEINNIPFVLPPTLPFNSLYALRLSLKSVASERQKELIDIFFRSIWEYGIDLGNADNVEKVLNEHHFDSQKMIEQISSKDVKKELRNNIESALEKGTFGVPSFIADKELFWGNDSLKYLDLYLAGKDPLPKQKYQEFINNYPM